MSTEQLTPAEGRRLTVIGLIEAELARAYAKHGAEPWGRHEFYGILLEEVELELWPAIGHDEPMERVLREALQVAAVVIRYLETGDRYRGWHDLDALHRSPGIGHVLAAGHDPATCQKCKEGT